jgi:hypothetical protein
MKTIVVVAENEHAALVRCELVRSVLSEGSSYQAQVWPACWMADVLDILEKGAIDVLIVGDRASGISGLGLVRWLEELLIGTTKILVTSDPVVLAEPWKFAGPEINEVLPEPLQRDALARTLQRWLGWPAASGAFTIC